FMGLSKKTQNKPFPPAIQSNSGRIIFHLNKIRLNSSFSFLSYVKITFFVIFDCFFRFTS
ncbi:MAG: hypothetical protein ACI8YQ_003465, partial [Polaribacter sp.]